MILNGGYTIANDVSLAPTNVGLCIQNGVLYAVGSPSTRVVTIYKSTDGENWSAIESINHSDNYDITALTMINGADGYLHILASCATTYDADYYCYDIVADSVSRIDDIYAGVSIRVGPLSLYYDSDTGDIHCLMSNYSQDLYHGVLAPEDEAWTWETLFNGAGSSTGMYGLDFCITSAGKWALFQYNPSSYATKVYLDSGGGWAESAALSNKGYGIHKIGDLLYTVSTYDAGSSQYLIRTRHYNAGWNTLTTILPTSGYFPTDDIASIGSSRIIRSSDGTFYIIARYVADGGTYSSVCGWELIDGTWTWFEIQVAATAHMSIPQPIGYPETDGGTACIYKDDGGELKVFYKDLVLLSGTVLPQLQIGDAWVEVSEAQIKVGNVNCSVDSMQLQIGNSWRPLA